MEANTGNHTSPHWRVLYEAAVLELNAEKFRLRIAQAEQEIMHRMEYLKSSDNSEGEALLNALNVVHDLRKIADNDR